MADDNNIKPYKVVLIGESGVGKTSIISRFAFNSFDANVETSGSASYSSKIIEYHDIDKEILLEIWDTIGQEKYRSLTKIFYKDADIVVLVFDMTVEKTFMEIKDFWFLVVKNNYGKDICKLEIFYIIYSNCDCCKQIRFS